MTLIEPMSKKDISMMRRMYFWKVLYTIFPIRGFYARYNARRNDILCRTFSRKHYTQQFPNKIDRKNHRILWDTTP